MIGKVVGEGVEAVLEDNGVWRSRDPIVRDYLNSRYSGKDHSPSDGVFGFRMLSEAAKALGGRVVGKKELSADNQEVIY